MSLNTENPVAILIDVLIFSSAVVLLSLVEWGIVPPFSGIGFYCKDPKLQFENKGDTVSIKSLLLISFVVPYFVFLCIERYQLSTNKVKNKVNNTLWVNRAHRWYFKYVHGLCFTFLVTDLIKLIVGEPRPHFFHTCKPLQAENCTLGQYISEYSCSNAVSNRVLTDSYKSFPSGHAAFSTYLSVFLIFYLAKEVITDSRFLINFLQLVCISWTLLCSLTRITDHRHHWWDVLSGSILGGSAALYFSSYRKLEEYNDIGLTGYKEKGKNTKCNLVS